MSVEQNTEYLDEKWTELMEAVNSNDFDSAERVAEQVKFAGFTFVSSELFKEIATARQDYEANKEPDDFTHANGVEN